MSDPRPADAEAPARADAAVGARKARDAGLILPLVGAVFFMPPVATVFAVDAEILGVPLVLAYVFAAWAGLILAAFLLARRLAETGADPARGPEAQAPDSR